MMLTEETAKVGLVAAHRVEGVESFVGMVAAVTAAAAAKVVAEAWQAAAGTRSGRLGYQRTWSGR